MKVNQQSHLQFKQPQVREQLSLIHRMDLVLALQFDNDPGSRPASRLETHSPSSPVRTRVARPFVAQLSAHVIPVRTQDSFRMQIQADRDQGGDGFLSQTQ